MRESLPLVDALTPKNFPLYEKLNLPMLLLFLELPPSFYDEKAGASSSKKASKKASKKGGAGGGGGAKKGGGTKKGGEVAGKGSGAAEEEGGGGGGGFYDDDDAETAGGGGGAGAYAAADGQMLHVGGTSGGVANDALLGEFLEAAKEHRGRIAFVYLDGKMVRSRNDNKQPTPTNLESSKSFATSHCSG